MRWLAFVLAAALFLAPAAEAKKFFGGVVPDVPSGVHATANPLARVANLPYGGGPVLHSNRTHLIFWEPAGSGLSYDAGYTSLIQSFLADVATDSHKATNPYGLSGQYRDFRGPAAYQSKFAGAVMATDPLPGNGCTEPLPPPLGTGPGWSRCLSDQQLEGELNRVISARHLPRAPNDIYFLVTPNGLGSCEFNGPDNCALGGSTTGSYCGYHSTTSDSVPYAVIPYNAVSGHCQSGNARPNGSTADPTISTISHEHNEAVTDPLGNAWVDSSSNEDGDLCISEFGPALGGVGNAVWNTVIHGHHYYVQAEWSNADGGCEQHAQPDRLSFSAPRRPKAGARLSFKANASAPQARIVAYHWWFGDGRTGHGRRPTHVYRRAGSYRAIVRATDSWENWVLSARVIHVAKAKRSGHR